MENRGAKTGVVARAKVLVTGSTTKGPVIPQIVPISIGSSQLRRPRGKGAKVEHEIAPEVPIQTAVAVTAQRWGTSGFSVPYALLQILRCREWLPHGW